MTKRIVVCADGTWGRPEKNPAKDAPTNVLRMARAVQPVAEDDRAQQVFYDWGIGSYYDPLLGGATGKGINKNIMDDYRYIVQNYSPGDEIFLFGFSRGAYTVRSLCGLINNCGILTRPDASLVQQAFDLYRKPGKKFAPHGEESEQFRARHSHPRAPISFVGVWDTVGALGIPLSFLGLLEREDEFHDTKLGSNVRVARHALAVDENRSDFEPTVWTPRDGLDLKQVWFVGSHGDVGGGYRSTGDGSSLVDIPLGWMMNQAEAAGLTLEKHLLASLNPSAVAPLHRSRRHIYRSRPRLSRSINHGKGEVLIHKTVRERWENDPKYRPANLAEYLEASGWPG